jgi:outer membrane protein insertion porin family
LWGVETPVLQDNPNGVQQRNAAGELLFIQRITNPDMTVTQSIVTSPTAPNGTPNDPSIRPGSRIRETFLGNSPSPRVTVGIGVNWNSPFGPFRIDFAQTIRKVEGDDERRFTFNVGTQF